MALDQAKLSELKDTIAVARKRSLAFGLCLGKKPEGTVLVTHKTKAPSILGKQAKSDGETGHFTFGTLSVKGKDLTLNLEGKMPQGIDRKLKELMKAAGMPMKINVVLPEGEEAPGDKKEQAEEAPKEKAAKSREEKPAEEKAKRTEEPAPSQAEEAPRAAPEAQDDQASSSSSDEEPAQAQEEEAAAPPDGKIQIGTAPAKADITQDFNEVRKDLMKNMGKLDGDAQAEVKDQIKKFGELMKSKDFKGAQDLMDDISVAQGTVSEKQRGRARDEVAEIKGMVGGVENELKDLKAMMAQQGSAA